MGLSDLCLILDETIYISLHSHAFQKGITPSLGYWKIEVQIGLFSLGDDNQSRKKKTLNSSTSLL